METEILIFKTNIRTAKQIKKVRDILSNQRGIKRWNVDIEDCDKVLRIETSSVLMDNVIKLFKPHKIYCEDLK